MIGRLTRPARALAAGALATCVDAAALCALCGLRVTAGPAAFAAAIAGGAVNFALSRAWVFPAASPSARAVLRQAALYALVVVGAGAALTGGLMHAACTLGGAPPLAARLAVAAIVFALWNYPVCSRLLARAPDPTEEASP